MLTRASSIFLAIHLFTPSSLYTKQPLTRIYNFAFGASNVGSSKSLKSPAASLR